VFLDGTKIKANASRRANRREADLRAELAAIDAEVAARMKAAEAADRTEVAEQLPEGLADPKARKAKLEAARAALRQRAAEQHRPPHDDDLGNTTDPDSRRQRTSQGGIQGYNAQIAATADGLIVAAHVCSDNQDRRQLTPTLQQVSANAAAPHTVVADTGYDSHEQITQIENTFNATVYIPPQMPVEVHTRQSRADARRSAERAQRRERVRTPLGQQLMRQRRSTVEPIFGIIKSARGFSRFLLRGLAAVDAEWSLLCTAFNLRRLHRLMAKPA
jgi:IS5 family transposase